MYQDTGNFYKLRSPMFQDFFIPVEESIVSEPEVFYPLENSCKKTDSEINSPIDYFYGYRVLPTPRESFTVEEAKKIGTIIGIDWSRSPFDVAQFRTGLDVELEHGRKDPQTNVTGDDPIMTGKIALAHLKEFPDYYIRLTKLEEEAKKHWESRH
jgi:hypothetical protein